MRQDLAGHMQDERTRCKMVSSDERTPENF